MKTAFVALALALSLIGSGIVLYNHHQTPVQDIADIPEESFIPLVQPDQAEVNETIEEFDDEQEALVEFGKLQGGVTCAFCGKNAFTAFSSCPAAVAQDGLNPWVDFKCISSVMKLPSNCKKCFCAIARHYRRRVRGC